jgi:hypothetical protein
MHPKKFYLDLDKQVKKDCDVLEKAFQKFAVKYHPYVAGFQLWRIEGSEWKIQPIMEGKVLGEKPPFKKP